MYLVMKRKQLSLGRHFSVRIMLAEAKGCRIIFFLNTQSNFLEGVPFNLLHELRIQQRPEMLLACQAFWDCSLPTIFNKLYPKKCVVLS